MTGKAPRVTLWPSAAQVLGALLDRFEGAGNPCFVYDTCEYAGDCDAKKSQNCKFGKQLQAVKTRLHKAGYP